MRALTGLLAAVLLLAPALATAGDDPFRSPVGGHSGSLAPALLPSDSADEVFSADDGIAIGPLPVAAADGDLGLVRRTDPRTEVGLAIRPGAIVDTAGFYGMIGAALDLGGSFRLNDRAEVFGTLTVLQFRFLQNATLAKTNLTLGSSSAGLSWKVVDREKVKVAPFARLHLPTSFEYTNAWPVGIEPGVSAAGPLSDRLAWHAGASIPVTAALSAGGTRPEVLGSAVAGGSWRPKRWLAVTFEAATRLAIAASIDPGLPQAALVEQVTAGAGLRFLVGQLGLELNGILPIAGSSRWDGAGSLRAAYRF